MWGEREWGEEGGRLKCEILFFFLFPVGSPLGSGGPVKSSAGSPLGAQKRDVSVNCIHTINI